MDLGITIFATDTTLQPIELGRAVEERGFESLWLPEHSHIPTSRSTPWGGRKDAPDLPEKYWRTHDVFVALAAIAAVTSTIRLGTGITLVAQHDPIWLAKQVASLDVISGGRVLFGVGFGWNVEEMRDHGVEPAHRRQLVREQVNLMKSLWTRDEASFEGELISLEPSWAWPKPVQKPHPPIILGAKPGPQNFDALFDIGTGWIPFGMNFADQMRQFRDQCAARGRDPEEFEITVYGAPRDAGRLEDLRNQGAHRALFTVESDSPTEVLDDLDDLTRFVQS